MLEKTPLNKSAEIVGANNNSVDSKEAFFFRFTRDSDDEHDDGTFWICYIPFPALAFKVLSVILFLVLIFFLMLNLISKSKIKCDGAPYLYITFHGHKGIHKYSRNGCLIASQVISEDISDFEIDFRSMAFAEYQGSAESLYVAIGISIYLF